MDMRAFDEDVIRRFRAGEEIDGLHRERLVLLTTTGRRSGERRTAPVMFVRFDGDPWSLVLLTTTGRRSGERRTAPVMFVRFDGDPLVIASNDGAPRHPDWLMNLRKDPHVTVETPDGASSEAVAEELSGDERTVEWEDLVAEFPFFREQQERAGARTIPLVRLRRCD